MPVAIPTKRMYLPPHLKDLSEDSFIRMLAWQRHAGILNNVASEIRGGIVAQSKYNRDNIPDKQAEEFPEADGITARIKTNPQGIRIPWGSVLDRFEGYVKFLLERYEKSIHEAGVITIDALPYVTTSHLQRRIEEYETDERMKAIRLLEVTGRGIVQEVSIVSPAELLAETPQELIIPFRGRNYGVFTGSNVRLLQNIKKMLADGERRTVGYEDQITEKYVERFMELLLNDTLCQLGLKPGELPSETPEPFSYAFPSGRAYVHKIERRMRPAYSEILEEFTKPFPKVIKKNSSIGDFSVLENMQAMPRLETTLREKDLIGDEFMEDYGARRRGEHTMVRLGGEVKGKPVGIIKRLEMYRSQHANPYVEQNLEFDFESLLA